MSNKPTPTESQKIIGGFAPHWALIDEGLEVDWSVEEVRRQAWELINALADQLDFYRRVLVGATVVDEAMIERGIEAIKGIPVMATRTAVEAVLRAALEVSDVE